MNKSRISPAMHQVTTRIARNHLRAVQFYAKHYDLPAPLLLASLTYGELTILEDDVFGTLEWIDSHLKTEDMEAITLEFCPDVYALMLRISQLLRRPLAELAGDVLGSAASTLADYIQTALEEDGMDGPNMRHWADFAIEFRRHLKRNQAPGWCGVESGWDRFNIKRRKTPAARLMKAKPTNPAKPPELPPMGKAEVLFLMTWEPIHVENLTPQERAARAMKRLLGVAIDLQEQAQGKSRIYSQEGFDSATAALVYESAVAALEWLSASSQIRGKGAEGRLYLLAKATGKAFMEEVGRKNPLALNLLAFEREEVRAAKKSLGKFNPQGGRKIDLETPDNQAVATLFRVIHEYRERWKMLLEWNGGDVEVIRQGLHPLVAEMVGIDDLSPDSWESWHKVGLVVKKELKIEIDSAHLRRSWKLWGKLARSIPLTTLLSYS